METEVDYNRISDLLTTIVETAVSDWYCITDKLEPEEWTIISTPDHPKPGKHWLCDYPLNKGGAWVVEDVETDSKYTFDLEVIKKGLNLMAKKYPEHFADFLEENDDAITADVFLQLCLFGEVIYG
jgi:hypothetical protein